MALEIFDFHDQTPSNNYIHIELLCLFVDICPNLVNEFAFMYFVDTSQRQTFSTAQVYIILRVLHRDYYNSWNPSKIIVGEIQCPNRMSLNFLSKYLRKRYTVTSCGPTGCPLRLYVRACHVSPTSSAKIFLTTSKKYSCNCLCCVSRLVAGPVRRRH